MTWEQLKALVSEGLDLAAHTCTHPLMTRISIEQAVHEATQSRQDLCRQLGTDLPVFAYPGGAYSPELVQPLRRAGFEVAFTTQWGINDLSAANPLLLRRINVSVATPRTAVRAQLLAGMRHVMPK
jgi:peptidoglycan/xylan/chitin deacetylase (PgdA/CDA1 family)